MNKPLYYIAVGKPRASRVWLPLFQEKGDIPILRHQRAACIRDGNLNLPYNIGPGNRFQNPRDWVVRAARVVL